MMRLYAAALLSLTLATGAIAAPPTPDGSQIFTRCAACHLPTGAGIPGAFPPLHGDIARFATMPEGRRYLVLAVTHGLSGAIVAEGKTYRGVMPAQSWMTDAQMAAVLNHVVTTLAKASNATPFTADEIARAKASGATMTAADVARLNGTLNGQPARK
jgi:mono/diheme cytochrome c family protein